MKHYWIVHRCTSGRDESRTDTRTTQYSGDNKEAAIRTFLKICKQNYTGPTTCLGEALRRARNEMKFFSWSCRRAQCYDSVYVLEGEATSVEDDVNTDDYFLNWD